LRAVFHHEADRNWSRSCHGQKDRRRTWRLDCHRERARRRNYRDHPPPRSQPWSVLSWTRTPPSLTPPRLTSQDAEKSRQRRSLLETILNVAQRLRLRCFHRLGPCWTVFLSIL